MIKVVSIIKMYALCSQIFYYFLYFIFPTQLLFQDCWFYYDNYYILFATNDRKYLFYDKHLMPCILLIMYHVIKAQIEK